MGQPADLFCWIAIQAAKPFLMVGGNVGNVLGKLFSLQVEVLQVEHNEGVRAIVRPHDHRNKKKGLGVKNGFPSYLAI